MGADFSVVGPGQAVLFHKHHIVEREFKHPGGYPVDMRGQRRQGKVGFVRFQTSHHPFPVVRLYGKKGRGIYRQGGNVFPECRFYISRIHIVPVDYQDFLNAVCHIEIPAVQNPHISRFVEISVVALHPGLEIFIILYPAPITRANRIAADVHLPHPAFFARLSGSGIHRQHGDAFQRFPKAHQFLSLPGFARDKTVLAQGFFLYPQSLIVVNRGRHQADILGHTVPAGKRLGLYAKQLGKSPQGKRINEFRAIQKVRGVREVKRRGRLWSQDVRVQGVCGIRAEGELHLILGKEPEPKRGSLQKLQRLQEIHLAFQGHNGQENPEKQAQVVEKRNPHCQRAPGRIIIDLLHLVHVGHQVLQRNLNPFGLAGGTRGILQINDLFRPGQMHRKFP